MNAQALAEGGRKSACAGFVFYRAQRGLYFFFSPRFHGLTPEATAYRPPEADLSRHPHGAESRHGTCSHIEQDTATQCRGYTGEATITIMITIMKGRRQESRGGTRSHIEEDYEGVLRLPVEPVRRSFSGGG